MPRRMNWRQPLLQAFSTAPERPCPAAPARDLTRAALGVARRWSLPALMMEWRWVRGSAAHARSSTCSCKVRCGYARATHPAPLGPRASRPPSPAHRAGAAPRRPALLLLTVPRARVARPRGAGCALRRACATAPRALRLVRCGPSRSRRRRTLASSSSPSSRALAARAGAAGLQRTGWLVPGRRAARLAAGRARAHPVWVSDLRAPRALRIALSEGVHASFPVPERCGARVHGA